MEWLHKIFFVFYSVIDFGDTNKNPIIFELGITIMYMMTQCKSIHPNEAGGHVLAGYETIRTLPPIGLRHLVFIHQGVIYITDVKTLASAGS